VTGEKICLRKDRSSALLFRVLVGIFFFFFGVSIYGKNVTLPQSRFLPYYLCFPADVRVTRVYDYLNM